MKVLQVHNRYREPGGEDRVVELEAKQLIDAGHEVVTYLTDNPEGGIGTARDLLLSPWNPFRARDVAAVVRKERPDLVHVHNTWFHLSPSVLRAIRSEGPAVVATMHNFRALCAGYSLYRDGHTCTQCVDERSPWSAVRHGCYRGSRMLSVAPAATIAVAQRRHVWDRDVDIVIALNEFGRDVLVSGGFAPEAVRVKHNFATDPGPRLSIPSASDRVLFVGRLTDEKGIAPLLQAWQESAPPGLELHIVGEGPLRPLADAAPDVTAHGWLPAEEVARLMLSSRALVFPSQWFEGFGLTLAEAMASGLPVLSTSIGSMQAVLGDDHELYFGTTASEMAGELHRLADDELVDRVGAALRGRYEARFTESATSDELLEVYRAALGRRSGDQA